MGNNQPFSLVLLLLLSLYSDAQQYVPRMDTSEVSFHNTRAHVQVTSPCMRGVPYNCLDSNTEQNLLYTFEVQALNYISQTLQVRPPRRYDIYSCRREDHYDGISCRCDFTYFTYPDKNERRYCRIRLLSLPDRALKGTIPPEIGNLTYLEKLDLSGNELTGPIPTTLWNLSHLQTLDLSTNQLNGKIPDDFGEMIALWSIDLSYNFLEGPIPPSLGVLPNLSYLYLYANLLTGPIPNQLGNASSLLYMSLDYNKLNGTLPPELGNLGKLRAMWLSGNNFTGKLPETFINLTKLDIFIVAGNDLSGPVPNFIGTKWKYLRYLHLMGNKFEGTLPPNIFELDRLILLWITDLRVDNDVFPSIKNLTSLKSLILRNCSIGGTIPDNIINGSLIELDLSYNKLSGIIPSGLGKLKFLCLTRNNLDGSIPYLAPNSPLMDFSYNNLANVSSLHLNETNYMNTFTPSILPSVINGRCPHDKHTSLHINCGGKSTSINGRTYEEDTSDLPFYVSPDKTWAYSSSGDFLESPLDPRNNTKNMTCGIPVDDAPLFASARISPLTLDYYGLCLRNGTYNVTLYFAEIVYWDKEDHSFLGKRLFDIYIQDELKVKDFNIKNEVSKPGEEGVSKSWLANVTDNRLNIHLYWAGKGTTYVRPAQYGPLLSAISVTSGYKPRKKLSSGTIAAITTSSVALPLMLLAILWKFGCLGLKKMQNDELEGEELKKRKLTFQDIREATQNFSSEMEIGSGGSGTVYKQWRSQKYFQVLLGRRLTLASSATVYKAVLKDGTSLAVKKLMPQTINELEEYIHEVKILESLKNENLVQLLGWYTRSDRPLLIFEYMEMNSLQKALFGDTKSRLVLSWKIRYNICLQIAKGLAYLHEDAKKKIIHRDINPNNILLDANLNAKISKFGLAKFYKEEQGTAETKLYETHGYMAPEYAQRGILSEKIDVYSYGILILEIASGKSNCTRESSRETVFLLDEACLLWKNGTGNIHQLVDASITRENEYKAQEASRVLSLAMLCTNQGPSLRPTMAEVVSVLVGETDISALKEAKSANPKHIANFEDVPVKRSDRAILADFSNEV